eukprot:8861346-Pyramimonas_sp.AAC.1
MSVDEPRSHREGGAVDGVGGRIAVPGGREKHRPPRWGPSRWGRRIAPHRQGIGDASAMHHRRR